MRRSVYRAASWFDKLTMRTLRSSTLRQEHEAIEIPVDQGLLLCSRPSFYLALCCDRIGDLIKLL